MKRKEITTVIIRYALVIAAIFTTMFFMWSVAWLSKHVEIWGGWEVILLGVAICSGFFLWQGAESYGKPRRDTANQARRKAAKQVKKAFSKVDWTIERFILDGKALENSKGLSSFYSAKSIDKAIKKLNKTLDELSG